jgi:hypothetical protein
VKKLFRHWRIWRKELRQLRDQHPAWYAQLNSRKYFSRWKDSLQEGRSTMTDEIPWLTFEAIDLLDSFLKKEMNVFEYGGGGSTLFFAKRVHQIVTAEHHPEWFADIQKQFSIAGIKNWEGHLLAAEEGQVNGLSIADPAAYVSDDAQYKGKHFRAYASCIDTFPDQHFDLILVDGRARPSCTAHALPKLKSGGWLVIDNTDRDYYLDAFRTILTSDFDVVLHNKGPAPYLTWFTQTSIWKKR